MKSVDPPRDDCFRLVQILPDLSAHLHICDLSHRSSCPLDTQLSKSHPWSPFCPTPSANLPLKCADPSPKSAPDSTESCAHRSRDDSVKGCPPRPNKKRTQGPTGKGAYGRGGLTRGNVRAVKGLLQLERKRAKVSQAISPERPPWPPGTRERAQPCLTLTATQCTATRHHLTSRGTAAAKNEV